MNCLLLGVLLVELCLDDGCDGTCIGSICIRLRSFCILGVTVSRLDVTSCVKLRVTFNFMTRSA